MKEGLNQAIALSFGPLGLRRLEADVDPRNEASLRLLESLGFRREGLMRERWNTGGELQDGVLLGLLAREWTGRAGD
jgi:RimJ/RimL family protein N-acetyltransferase